MAGAAQADRARRDARGGSSGARPSLRDRPVGFNSSRRAVTGVELRPVDTRDAGEIERAITAFAQFSNGGLIVTGSPETVARREVIITMATRHRLPAVYPYPLFVADGGLIAYGPDAVDSFRRAAGYVDRILKGEKPANLPVQA